MAIRLARHSYSCAASALNGSPIAQHSMVFAILEAASTLMLATTVFSRLCMDRIRYDFNLDI